MIISFSFIVVVYRSGYASSLELITKSGVCTPPLPSLPAPSHSAQAFLYGQTIFLCGGTADDECFSLSLADPQEWLQEAGMLLPRTYFATTVIGDTVYATGGVDWNTATHDTVESFQPARGWRLEETMLLSTPRQEHCSVNIGSRLIIIGGNVGDSWDENVASVEAFDVSSDTGSWTALASLNTARKAHSCAVFSYEGEEGVFVAGGLAGNIGLNSVEFYRDDIWWKIGDMTTNRLYFSLSVVGGQLVAAGGETNQYPDMTSIETLNSTEWVQTYNLQEGRHRHSAVSFPAELLTCLATHMLYK